MTDLDCRIGYLLHKLKKQFPQNPTAMTTIDSPPLRVKPSFRAGDKVMYEGYEHPFTVETFDEATYTCCISQLNDNVLLRLVPVCAMELKLCSKSL